MCVWGRGGMWGVGGGYGGWGSSVHVCLHACLPKSGRMGSGHTCMHSCVMQAGKCPWLLQDGVT